MRCSYPHQSLFTSLWAARNDGNPSIRAHVRYKLRLLIGLLREVADGEGS